MPVRTLGLSPKLIAPLITAASAVITSWITTGHFNRPQLAVLAVALLGAVAAYFAPPGELDVPDLHALPFDVDQALDDEQLDDVALPGEQPAPERADQDMPQRPVTQR